MEQHELLITIILGIFFVGHTCACLFGNACTRPWIRSLQILAVIACFVFCSFADAIELIAGYPFFVAFYNIAKYLFAGCALIMCINTFVHWGYIED